jgi:cysteine-rich repeat protein
MSRWNKTLGCTALAAAGLLLGCGDDGGPPANCGDGVVQMAEGEQCDDGNVELGDGCSNLCTEEPGFECEGEPSECLPVGECGNGVVNFGEECDDGMMTAACNPDCTVSECGDGFPNSAAGEECDDGNVTPGDGCASTCLVEPDTCGNGACELEGEETCGNCPTDCAANPACNDCEDADEDGFFAVECGGFDCADDNPDINPGMAEIPCNDVDDDCSPATTDFGDSDGDGSACDEDCDDTDPMRSPDFMEVCGNDVDDDCDPSTPDVQDADSDGFACDVDCDDGNAMVNPEADEVCDNFQDDDCDPSTFDLFDGDGDGWQCQLDCDDGDMTVVPGETDADGDGVTCERDCDDGNPNISPDQEEICNNGIDDDCDASTPDLFDMDEDGVRCDMDCDDDDALVGPGLREICGNGKDDDCDPSTSDDVVDSDGDSFTCETDCDDMDPSIVPDEFNRCGPGFTRVWDFEADDGGWTVGGSGSSWEWGAPDNDFISEAATGDNAWVTNLTGEPNENERSYIESPAMDFSTVLDDPRLILSRIFESGFGEEAWVEVSTDGGAIWRKLGEEGSGIGWYDDDDDVWDDDTEDDDDAPEWRFASHPLPQTAGASDVRLRIFFQSNSSVFDEGFGVDDIIVSNELVDMGVTALPLGGSICGSGSQPVQIDVRNQGVVPVSEFDVSFTVDGGAPMTETVTETLEPGQSLTYAFTAMADLSGVGAHTVEASVSVAEDGFATNDTRTAMVESLPILDTSTDYQEGFESGPGGWTVEGANASWEHGMPSGTFIPAAASGASAWVTNLDGDYNSNEESYLVSPCFDPSGFTSDPAFRFSHIFETESCCDEGWVEVSIDGGEWTTLGRFGSGINWYDDESNDWWDGDSGMAGEWRPAQQVVQGVTGASSLRLRFVVDTDGSVTDEGFGVDDILLSDDIVDVGIEDVRVSSGVCASGASDITVTVRNFGAAPVTSYDVAYMLDGGAPVMESPSAPIAPGESVDYTFSAPADLSMPGDYSLEAVVTTTDDVFVGNDSDTVDLSIVASVTVPAGGYTEAFEADDGGWAATGDSSTWEWGAPSGSFISSAASGTNAWVTNLDGNYDVNEESAVESPCFDLSAFGSDPTLSFSHIFHTENLFDEGWIEVSIDGGETWAKLGAEGEGTNWYNTSGDAWDDEAPMWRTASHVLDGTAGETQVRIRHRFSSDGSVTEEGFGLDDVMVMP